MKIKMIEYFCDTVQRYPQRNAIVEGDIKISFQELDDRCKTLAAAILDKDCTLLNKPIAIYLPKSIECIIADIAVLYSGNAYMNLDVKTPEIRIRNTIEQARPAFIITSRSQETAFLAEFSELIYIEDIMMQKNEKVHNLIERLSVIIDTDPMCIINTSGSTGTPKGVVLNHRSFKDYTEWAITDIGFSDEEIIGSLSPIVFDHYSFELCLLMAKGVTFVILDEAMSAFPARLLEKMKCEDVTFIFWVPSIMVNIANMDLLSKIDLPELKMVWFAGEVFPTKQFNYWRKHLDGVKFVNLYGPAEATVDCIYYVVDRVFLDDEPIPIGRPCRNVDILLLKDDDTLAQNGEEGEICIRGTSLSMGYYRDSEKTRAVFTQNPLNKAYPELIYHTGDIAYMNDRGEYIFKGRKDTLIKHMGCRIELSEIEHTIISRLKLVQYCCVVYNTMKKEITLFYEAEQEIPVSKFRKELLTVFPKYMLPVKYIRKEQLPRNVNGKIDRNKLNSEINN